VEKKKKKEMTYEELIEEYDDDEIWDMYMEEHLKEEEEGRKRFTKNEKTKKQKIKTLRRGNEHIS